MALANFSLPFGSLVSPWSPSSSPLHPIHHQLAAHTNNLLYSPAEHQQQADGLLPPLGSSMYVNNPYAMPNRVPSTSTSTTPNPYHLNANNRRRNTYLPPVPNPPTGRSNAKYNTNQINFHHHQQQHQQQPQQQQQQQQQLHQYINTDKENNQNFSYETESAFLSSAYQNDAGRKNNHNHLSSFAETGTRLTKPFNEENPFLQQQYRQQQQQQQQFLDHYEEFSTTTSPSMTTTTIASLQTHSFRYEEQKSASDHNNNNNNDDDDNDKSDNNDNKRKPIMNKKFPDRPAGFTRVVAGKGSRTQLHAVLDYDIESDEEKDDDYYYDAINQDDSSSNKKTPTDPAKATVTVTPIQGPIFIKNGTVPVVPLYSYPTVNNGTLIQIPIWWTALSVALGLNISGDIIKGVPCIKRFNQLYCPTAGNSYPIEKIERFIDENKALMRRMYGDFEMNMDDVVVVNGSRQKIKKRKRRFIDDPDLFIPPGILRSTILSDHDDRDHDESTVEHSEETGDTYFGKLRNKRQTSQSNRNRNRNAKQMNRNSGSSSGSSTIPKPPINSNQSTGRMDACESNIEIVTPYWASNSAGKIRAIVNTQHFEQAIHQETCSKTQTSRCQSDCGCEQKYKWHRLLAYDPDNDCKGIFMDWFLFPSCCVCRCNP